MRYLKIAAAIAWVAGVALSPHAAFAQSFSLDFGPTAATGPNSTTTRIIQLLLLMTVLSVAPALLMMVTAFTLIAFVLSILRHALGTNTSPPNAVGERAFTSGVCLVNILSRAAARGNLSNT